MTMDLAMDYFDDVLSTKILISKEICFGWSISINDTELHLINSLQLKLETNKDVVIRRMHLYIYTYIREQIQKTKRRHKECNQHINKFIFDNSIQHLWECKENKKGTGPENWEETERERESFSLKENCS